LNRACRGDGVPPGERSRSARCSCLPGVRAFADPQTHERRGTGVDGHWRRRVLEPTGTGVDGQHWCRRALAARGWADDARTGRQEADGHRCRRALAACGWAGDARTGRQEADGPCAPTGGPRKDGPRTDEPAERTGPRPDPPARTDGPLGSGARRGHFFVVVLFLRVVVRLAGAFFLAGPFARFSASFSIATFPVISSTFSVARSETFVVPSVMYGPKRPSLITIGFSLVGSVPSSFSGGLAAARPRVLGWA